MSDNAASFVGDIPKHYDRDIGPVFFADFAEAMAKRIAERLPTYPWLVAEEADALLGYAYAGRHRERAAYRWSVDVTVYVDGAQRRRGIGRLLYRALVAMLRAQGFRSAIADITLPSLFSTRPTLTFAVRFLPSG